MREWVRGGLLATAAVAGLVLVVRAWVGPFEFGASVHSPINSEAIYSSAIVLALLLTRANKAPPAPIDHASPIALASSAAALVALLTLALRPTFFVGFVADDYAHILAASKADLATVAHWFTVPASDNLFFRPVAMATYWADATWAGFSPVRWHAAEFAIHTLNTVLVFALGRRLGLSFLWAFAAAALFGVHGTRPEAVTWVAARFDLFATLFALAALHAFLTYRNRPRSVLLAAMLALVLCGLLSKEAAFVLPLLMAATAWYFGWRREDTRAIAATLALAAIAFAYRWWVIGGIGGYKDAATGQATIGQFHVLLTAKALLQRLWAVLFVPLNWTDALSLPLQMALTLSAAAVLVLAWRGRLTRLAGFGLLFTLIAALPVYHLLLIGPDLEKSRVVYLGSVGFALFLAAAASTLPRPTGHAVLALILTFQITAVRHNLRTWQRVSQAHLAACQTLTAAARDYGQVLALDMPNTFDGVYMLATGLPECVEIRSGIPASHVHLVPSIRTADDLRGVPAYFWDEPEARVREIREIAEPNLPPLPPPAHTTPSR